jgi:membrane associated rhomboid family serine protease
MKARQQFLRLSLKAARHLVWDFRSTLLIVAVVLALSFGIEMARESGLVSRDQLMASRTNLLGLVVSIFSHWDMTRLQENAQTLLFLAVIYPFTNFSQETTERVRRSSWFAVVVFPLAVIVNVLSVLLSPASSLGASGLVMAGFGIAFAFFLLNSIHGFGHLTAFLRKEIDDPDKRRAALLDLWWLPWNALLFVFYLFFLVFDRAALFGLGDPAINGTAHIVGFGMGFALTAFLWDRMEHQEGKFLKFGFKKRSKTRGA